MNCEKVFFLTAISVLYTVYKISHQKTFALITIYILRERIKLLF